MPPSIKPRQTSHHGCSRNNSIGGNASELASLETEQSSTTKERKTSCPADGRFHTLRYPQPQNKVSESKSSPSSPSHVHRRMNRQSLSRPPPPPKMIVVPRRVPGAGNIERLADLHEILENDLAAWSYRMHIAIYQNTPTTTCRTEHYLDNRGEDLGNASDSPSQPSSEDKDQRKASQPLLAPQLPQINSPPSILQCTIHKVVSEAESKDVSGSLDHVPLRLHRLLDDLAARPKGKEIASFLPHGRAFCVYKPKEFAEIMKHYFNMTLFSSFQRQLLLYKFERVKHGRDKGAYFHELFQKGNPMKSTYMRPMKTLRRLQPKGSQESSPCVQQEAV